MKILMVGASGRYAHDVVPQLKSRGATIRALIRSKDKHQEALANGAGETAIGDLTDPNTLRKAAQGCDGVFHLNPAFQPNESELGLNMVHAAIAAGVKKFTFSGVIHPTISKMRNHAAKQLVEEAIYESGLTYTVLQPTMFMQTILNSWPEITKNNTFSLPYSNDKKASYVDYRDVAEAAAIALTTTKLDNGTFELCAPGQYTRPELTQIISQALGRSIEARNIPFEDWAKQANIPQGPFRDGMKRMYAHYDQYGFPGGNALVLEAVLGRPPRTLEAFFEEQAKS